MGWSTAQKYGQNPLVPKGQLISKCIYEMIVFVTFIQNTNEKISEIFVLNVYID